MHTSSADFIFLPGFISSFVTAETASMFPEITSPGSSVLLLKVGLLLFRVLFIVMFLALAYGLTWSHRRENKVKVMLITWLQLSSFSDFFTLFLRCKEWDLVPSVTSVLILFSSSATVNTIELCSVPVRFAVDLYSIRTLNPWSQTLRFSVFTHSLVYAITHLYFSFSFLLFIFSVWFYSLGRYFRQ